MLFLPVSHMPLRAPETSKNLCKARFRGSQEEGNRVVSSSLSQGLLDSPFYKARRIEPIARLGLTPSSVSHESRRSGTSHRVSSFSLCSGERERATPHSSEARWEQCMVCPSGLVIEEETIHPLPYRESWFTDKVRR